MNTDKAPLHRIFCRQLTRFDALDWVAAFFIIATPIYIGHQLTGIESHCVQQIANCSSESWVILLICS